MMKKYVVFRVAIAVVVAGLVIQTIGYQAFAQKSSVLLPRRNADGKMGYVDEKGKWKIPARYDFTSPFYQLRAVVQRGDSFFFIKPDGSALTTKSFDLAWNFYNGFALVYLSGKYAFVDTSGQLVKGMWFDKASLMFSDYAEMMQGSSNFLLYKDGSILSFGINTLPRLDEEITEYPVDPPSFPGGSKMMRKYLNGILKKYMSSQGFSSGAQATVQFVVERNGLISNIVFQSVSSPSFEAACLLALQELPPWNPGRKENKPVRCRATISILFDE